MNNTLKDGDLILCGRVVPFKKFFAIEALVERNGNLALVKVAWFRDKAVAEMFCEGLNDDAL